MLTKKNWKEKIIRVNTITNKINLWKFSFTKYPYKLSNKNFNFCSTPERYNIDEEIKDFKEFKKKKENSKDIMRSRKSWHQLIKLQKKYNTGI